MMAKQTTTKTVRKVRESKFEFLTGYLCVYGETKRSLVVAPFDMDYNGRCDSVYIIHKVSPKKVLNPYMNDDWTPVHERITSVWDLVRA
jgi:hypothetical protein